MLTLLDQRTDVAPAAHAGHAVHVAPVAHAGHVAPAAHAGHVAPVAHAVHADADDAAHTAPVGLLVGPDQGVIEEARRRRRLRCMRMALAALLALAGLALLAWALGAGGTWAGGRQVGQAGGVGVAAGGAATAAGFNVRLSPALDGGQYGWCVAVEEGTGAVAGGGCATTPVTSTPLAMRLSSASARTDRQSIVVLTTPQVAGILVNGRGIVPTYALPGLPYGLRAARVVMALKLRGTRIGRRGFAPPPEPKLVALDGRGQVIASRIARRSSMRLSVSGRGPCALRAAGLPGLAAQWSHVAGAIRPFPGKLIGRGFFSCIDTEYYLHQWPLDAAILLDGAHPGTPPATIPGLTPVAGARGYFNGPGDFKGALTATRVGNAWLVVAGGSGVAQRIEVLRHLTPTVRL